MLYKISYIGYKISLFTKEDISFIQSNKRAYLVYQIYSISILIYDILFIQLNISFSISDILFSISDIYIKI